jgi:hypothetical protein
MCSCDSVPKISHQYRAEAIDKHGLPRRYTLRARAYPDIGTNLLEYIVVREGLTVRTESIPSSTHQIFASFSNWIEQRKAAYTLKKAECK